MASEEGREDPDLKTPEDMKREKGEIGGVEMEARQHPPATAGRPIKYSHDCE
jgi:hypothetical protein